MEKTAKDFPYPLDTDIEEHIPVEKNVVEIDERGVPIVRKKTVMEKQTVRYMDVPKVKTRCRDGEHVFRVFNAPKWMFACTLCPFVRKVYPTTYRFEEKTGKLIHRRTGRAV